VVLRAVERHDGLTTSADLEREGRGGRCITPVAQFASGRETECETAGRRACFGNANADGPTGLGPLRAGIEAGHDLLDGRLRAGEREGAVLRHAHAVAEAAPVDGKHGDALGQGGRCRERRPQRGGGERDCSNKSSTGDGATLAGTLADVEPVESERVEPAEPVIASEGWGVLHLLYTVDRARAEREPDTAKRMVAAVDALQRDGHQALCFAVLGHKADVGVMALGPDLARLQQFQHEMLTAPFTPGYSYVSLTELSEYTSTEDDERARLRTEEQLDDDALEAKLVAWRERMAHYAENRLHPNLPAKKVICFYPMSKRRDGEDNWFTLPFADRKRLMGGHARVGRTYAGRVLQLITGSVGIDDWEWGVTLLADDPAVLKEIVYEMRFDEVSARYAEFGPFVTGLVLPPDAVLRRVGLSV